MESEHFPFNTPFKPSPSLITWFDTNFIILVFILFIFMYAPIILFTGLPLPANLLIIGIIVVGMVIFFVWVKLLRQHVVQATLTR